MCCTEFCMRWSKTLIRFWELSIILASKQLWIAGFVPNFEKSWSVCLRIVFPAEDGLVRLNCTRYLLWAVRCKNLTQWGNWLHSHLDAQCCQPLCKPCKTSPTPEKLFTDAPCTQAYTSSLYCGSSGYVLLHTLATVMLVLSWSSGLSFMMTSSYKKVEQQNLAW